MITQSRKWDVFASLSLAAGFGISAALYARLPDMVPTHFDIHGVPNGFMPRVVAALFVPLLAGVAWALTRFTSKRTAASAMPKIAAFTALFMTATHAIILRAAVSPGSGVNRPVLVLVAVFFMALGLVLPRVRRNAFVGVRTPWTLGSDENWARSNRLAGTTMVLGGAVGGVAALAGGTAGAVLALLSFLAAALVPGVYSLVLARSGTPRS